MACWVKTARKIALIGPLLIGAGGAVRAEPATISITLAGQSMIRSDLRQSSPATLAAMSPLLGGDVKFTDFETTIIEDGQPVGSGRNLSPPGALDALQALGFNLVALCNNHAFDLGATGIENTLKEARKINLVHAGIGANLAEASAPAYLHTANGTVALVATSSGLLGPEASATPTRPGVNELRVETDGKPNEGKTEFPASSRTVPVADDARRILDSIGEAHRHAALVIAYQHNHIFNQNFTALFREEMPERLVPPAWIRKWAHDEVDAGADIVVMHGAPLLHGVEIYKGRPIFYDLGNFIFNLPPVPGESYLDEPIIWESAVAHVDFRDGKLKAISFQPIVMNKIGQGQPDFADPHANNLFLQTRGLPGSATGDQARYILQRLADASKEFGTVVKVKGGSAFIDLP